MICVPLGEELDYFNIYYTVVIRNVVFVVVLEIKILMMILFIVFVVTEDGLPVKGTNK